MAFGLNLTLSLQLEYEKTDIRIQAVLPGPIRTEFFTAQGLDDSVFPASAYIGPDALVEAALAGPASGEQVTVPTLVDAGIGGAIEKDIGRTHVCSPVTNAHIVCRLLLEKTTNQQH